MITSLHKLYLQLLQSILDVWNCFSSSLTVSSSIFPTTVVSMAKSDVSFINLSSHPAGMFCRLQVAGCRLKFHYNWKTAETKNN